MKRLMVALIFAAMAASGIAETAERTKEDVLREYERTGEFRNCLVITQIYKADVLDDQTLLFDMNGPDYYLNEMPRKCPQLAFFDAFSYETYQTRLCNSEIITVLDSNNIGQRLASCPIGMFELLRKKEEQPGPEAVAE